MIKHPRAIDQLLSCNEIPMLSLISQKFLLNSMNILTKKQTNQKITGRRKDDRKNEGIGRWTDFYYLAVLKKD